MFNPSLLATAFVVNLSAFLPAQPPETKKAAEDPEQALAVAIKLLKAKDHTGFVKRFMRPADLALSLKTRDLDDVAKDELGGRADRWLREFVLVKGTKPVFNNKRTQATFSAKGADRKTVSVTFILIDGKWYLK